MESFLEDILPMFVELKSGSKFAESQLATACTCCHGDHLYTISQDF